MSRITEDVSRVRMYTGPAIMYLINLVTLIGLALYYMLKKDVTLTLYVLAPLPILAITIYFVNSIINKKSERIQALLSNLTTNAQETYAGIRVIKSFVQEKAMLSFFEKNSEDYKKNAIDLAKVESIYFPSMALLIGLSTIVTIFLGGLQALQDPSRVGVIVEFVIYINMLTFPVSAIGWTASMIQRAAASQKRLNEFLDIKEAVSSPSNPLEPQAGQAIVFDNVNFVYNHTGIKALSNFSLTIGSGEKVLVLGKTGSGKSTLAQLMLRFYDPTSGQITMGGIPLQQYNVQALRNHISYVQQDVFLFSDTVADNISFGSKEPVGVEAVKNAAALAAVDHEIEGFDKGYDTLIGERGVTLSGGQKQRISIARALLKTPELLILDDCLSAVDAKTEHKILNNLAGFLDQKTAIVITHRIFSVLQFDKIVVLEEGRILEMGTHASLLEAQGYYAELYRLQRTENDD
jgi:ATP-binding cassette subfamily B protein